MKVLIDTNVIVDIALERLPFYDESDQVFALIEQHRFEGYVSASTIGDLYYIIRKVRGQDWTRNFLTRLVNICRIATVNQEAIAMALTANFSDLEDGIQYGTAVVNQLDGIVTRNTQDFLEVGIRILTPNQLIQEFIDQDDSV